MFQALVNDVLRDMLNHIVFVHLDDKLIYSTSLETHCQHVCLVLQRLLENKLFTKAEKCEFHVPRVSFLSFIVEKGKMDMDPTKVSTIMDWPIPTSRKDLQRFLGFANFYRFICNYSSIVNPLTNLSSTKTKRLRMHSTTSRSCLHQPQYWPNPIPPVSSWLKLTLLIPGWEPFSLKAPMTVNSIHVLSSPVNFRSPNVKT